jgi:hypothetical protein
MRLVGIVIVRLGVLLWLLTALAVACFYAGSGT